MSSIKKCPKCGGSTEIIGEGAFDYPPESGGQVQEIKLGIYKCKQCGNLFSDEKVIGKHRFSILVEEHIHE